MTEQPNSLLVWIVFAPLIGALLNLLVWPTLAGLLRVKVPRWIYLATGIGSVFFAFALGVASAVPLHKIWVAAKGGHVDGLVQEVYRWIEVGKPGDSYHFSAVFKLRFDTLTAVMVGIITFVGTAIHVYSAGYMKGDPRERTYFGYLNLFMGAMLILVLADNLLVMFIGWEGVGLCSYLLIGFWFEKKENADAGRKAFIVNRIGDFAFILGMCLLFWATKTLSFHDIGTSSSVGAKLTQSYIGGERLALFAGLLLFIGACGKSAQIPLYVWLPDAMAGPTPVSALIHAATMVTAGVYMVARLSVLYASSSTIMAIVAIVGALTAAVAAFIAFTQTDIKKVLAYSTVSQLGFMFAAVGMGAFVAGIFHVMTHAFFKAGLFLGAGSVMHAMSGSGDIMKMGGLARKLKITHATFLVFCLAIAGFPLLSGFFSKDEILAAAFVATGGVESGWPMVGGFSLFGVAVWGVLTVAALGTAFYMFRLYALVFLGECRADKNTQAHIHESPPSMTIPLTVLAVLAIFAGYLGMPHIGGLPNVIGSWLDSTVISGDQFGHASELRLLILMAVATAVALVGIASALLIYRNGPSAAIDRMTSGWGRFVYKFSKNKIYLDELYDLIIVRPFRATCRWTFEVIDRFIVDFLVVDGSAFVVDILSRVLRWFQNGQLQRYLIALVIAIAVILFWTNRGGVDFDYEVSADGSVRFEVVTGEGPGSRGAVIEWDFNDDGEIDAKGANPIYKYTSRGEHRVTLRFKDGTFGSWREVTKTVDVAAGGSPPAEFPDSKGGR